MSLAYAFVDDLISYTAALAEFPASGIVPICRPADPERSSRWVKVLCWYGFSANGARAEPPVASPAFEHLVVGVGPTYAEMAEVYAGVACRAFMRAPVDLSRFQFGGGVHDSVLFVGPPTAFSAPIIRGLTECMRAPWGILTAHNTRALTFVIAKLLASTQSLPASSAIADAIGDKWYDAMEGSSRRTAAENSADVIAWLLQPRDALGIRAHGEGAHIKMAGAVLCGLIGTQELDRTGNVVYGCHRLAGRHYCKRVPGDDLPVLSFDQVRCTTLLLHTCSAFPVSADIYPSNSSAVLSALDGYVRSLLVTDRQIAVPEWAPVVSCALRADGAGLGGIAGVLNDVAIYREGCAPYVVFGDPAGARPNRIPAPLNTPVTCEASAVTVFLMEGAGSAEILRLNPAVNGVHFIRGRDSAVLLQRPGAPRLTVTIEDASHRLQLLKRRLEDLERKSRATVRLHHSIANQLAKRLNESSSAVTHMDRLQGCSAKLEQTLQLAYTEIAYCHSTGTWNPRIADLERLASGFVRVWDAMAARLIGEDLWMEFNFEVYLAGCLPEGRSQSGSCEYCASPVSQTRWRDPFSGFVYLREDCPLCGELDAWREGRLAIRSIRPEFLEPGEQVTMHAACVTNDPLGRHGDIAHLISGLVDKGRGELVFRDVQKLSSDTTEIVVRVPENISSELHTIGLLWIRGLDLALHSRRWPTIRRTPASSAAGLD